MIHEARRTVPSVLYIPHLTALWRDVMNPSLQAAFLSMVADIPPTAPLLILAIMEQDDFDQDEEDLDVTSGSLSIRPIRSGSHLNMAGFFPDT